MIELERLVKGDPDIAELMRIEQEPSVSRYCHSSDNFFDYVTETEGVYYYKIMADGVPVGGIHSEINGDIMYLAVYVSEKYRRTGIAEESLKKYFSMLPSGVNTIEACIEEANIPSQQLFRKLGFKAVGQEEELITFVLDNHITEGSDARYHHEA